ncbi:MULTISPECIES: histidine triad nucleotide-binding protein [Thermodesulfobacterium]|jgi:histidine triad (HIT) family protein|uniref:HIT family hydrolase n=2 Tax=Thermodesulfobacterium commune TaxID=1741 RepID=A0A075WSN2_9BACT|nr:MULTISPECIES: histidine triad nucleotide-binding protein [Thermodesulfobacterium]KUJ97180.1 MAG: Histidine triad (HIT) protein [Thermodesulfobacterium sp. 37_54]KUK18982.1 MAG: Histidine triad (HIT) protein [Thermodesulfobacterium commune]AIH03418.1 HIT family hydrolase [Thermodesulfobacterium commune DSM 2178]KUK38623.1 MAG: Histidine triad (HIT) protein [Thermodesulfobacterium commune]MBZ4681125.1 family hydrolase [Thermodesulfobacterium sp.]
MDCIFCKIVKKEIPSKVVYEDEKVVAFHDINPQAPYHILVIPKKHLSTLLDLTEEDKDLIGHIYLVINRLAKDLGFAERGYRVVVNCKEEAGQTVFHLHFHLLAGRTMGWPPG